MIILKQDKPNFRQLFKSFLSNYRSVVYEDNYFSNIFMGDDYADWYDYEDDDYDYDDIRYNTIDYHSKSRKHNNRGSRGKHKTKCIPLYPKSKKNKISSLLADDFIMVYFYNDINDPDNSCETFYSLAEFDQFLEDNGIIVSELESSQIMNRPVSHCCINPLTEKSGIKELISASNFGSLQWDCATSDKDFVN